MKQERGAGWPQGRARVRGRRPAACRRPAGSAGPGPVRSAVGAAACGLRAPGRPCWRVGHAGKCSFPLLLTFQARSVTWQRAVISSAVAVRAFFCRFHVIFCAVLSASFNEKTGCERVKSGLVLQSGGSAKVQRRRGRSAAACWPRGGNASKKRRRRACARSAAACWPKGGTASSTEDDTARACAVAPPRRENAR